MTPAAAPNSTSIQRALKSATEVGIAEAARRHGVGADTLRTHARRLGVRCPHIRRGNTTSRYPELDGDLATLCALFPGQSFTLREIAEIIGSISPQGLHAIEQRALRKIRQEFILDGLWSEAAPTL